MSDWLQELPQNAALSPAHSLWVPMRMEALVCGTDVAESSFINLTPQYDELNGVSEGAALGHMLKPGLRAGDGVNAYMKPGIHLHWTLPAAFRHIRPPADQNGQHPEPIPRAPNRWCVTRIWTYSKDELCQKSWIVESDFSTGEGSQEDGAPWLDFDRAGKSYISTKVGQVVPQDKWTEPGTASEQRMTALTAFAPANPAFAAFYPSCRSVFGLHDDADGLTQGTVCTYLVAGWFSRTSDDPLSGARDKAAWVKCMRDLGWEISEKTERLPKRTVCYATIRDVTWTQSPPKDVGVRPNAVALGNGFLEAIAAISKIPTSGYFNDLSARLRNQLELAALRGRRPTKSDILPDSVGSLFTEMGQFPSLRARLHERTFSALPGGTVWEIARKENAAAPQERNAEPVVDLPSAIATDLYQINLLQRQQDELERELRGARRNLFGAWYHHAYGASVSGPSYDSVKPKLRDQMCEAQAKIGELEVENVQAQLDSLKAKLKTALEASGEFKDYELLSRAMPRFWRANDPFVLLSGLQVREVQGGRSPLMCRVSDQWIDCFVADRGIRIERADLRNSQKVKNLLREHAKVPADVTELLLDLLFSHQVAIGLLAEVYSYKTSGNPSPTQVAQARTAIEQAQTNNIWTAANSAWEGEFGINGLTAVQFQDGGSKLPSWSFLSALNPSTTSVRAFTPVFMLWKAEWHPYYRCAVSSASHGHEDAQQEISAAWDLKSGGSDLVWKQGVDPRKPDPTIYDGFTIVARRLERGLETTKQKFGAYDRIFNDLKGLVGQNLAGLTEALRLLDSGPQLPPPDTVQLEDNSSLQGLKKAIGDQYGAAPLVTHLGDKESNFFPIRGGHLRLTRLWLVDTFGRIRPIIELEQEDGADPLDPEVHFGHALKSSGEALAHFPPRLVQPSRLLFRWVSAKDNQKESIADLQTSPICGWIMYNRLDRSFIVYGAGGAVLGAVRSVGDPGGTEEVSWSTLPQRPRQEAAQVTEADIENKHLRGFVNGLLSHSQSGNAGSAINDLRDLLYRIENRSGPPPEQGLHSIISGRPLALVRASLRLEVDGPPIIDRSLSYLSLASAPDGKPSFMNVAFPVRIGDRRLGADGLIGYFVDEGDAPAYTKMRLSAEQEWPSHSAANSYLESGLTVNVTCTRPDDPPLGLTLLMEPRLGVHIVSAILPVNLVTLPPSLVSATMAALQLNFLVAPVFGERASKDEVQAPPIMPVPTNGQHDWAWISIDEQGQKREAPITSDSGGAGSALFAARALYEGWLRYRAPNGPGK
jgi:hypothetical protein